MDMLAYQTNLYVQLVKTEGISNITESCKECMINIQTVIEMKKNLDLNTSDAQSSVSLAQDKSPMDPVA